MAKAGSEKAKGGGRPAASSHELDNRDEEANGDGRRQKSRRVGNRSASSGPRGAKARQEPRPQLTAEELELERIWNLPVQWDVPDVPRAPQVAPLPDKIDRGRFIRPVAEDLLCDPTGVLDELGFQVDPETCVPALSPEYGHLRIFLRRHCPYPPLASIRIFVATTCRAKKIHLSQGVPFWLGVGMRQNIAKPESIFEQDGLTFQI